MSVQWTVRTATGSPAGEESHSLRQKPLFMGGLNFFEKSVDKLSKAWYISEADSREQ